MQKYIAILLICVNSIYSVSYINITALLKIGSRPELVQLQGVEVLSRYALKVTGKDASYILPYHDGYISNSIALFGEYEKPHVDLVKSIINNFLIPKLPTGKV